MTQRNTKTSRARKPKDDAMAINKEVNGKPVLGIVKEQSVTEYSSSAMTVYGSEVVEQRAIPDFRDGLKPVHRCVLWAAHQAGFKSNGPFRKSARIVGDVIGKYHPHGDGSAYDALVGVSGTRRIGQTSGWYTRNSSVPLIEGRGNFGDFIDSAAAYRYCFVGSTRIMTDLGLIRIADLPKAAGFDIDHREQGLKVELNGSVTADSLKDALPVSHWINSGVREVYEVTTAHGYRVVCTENEPLYVLNSDLQYEWVDVADLKRGSYVSLKRGTNCVLPESGAALPEFQQDAGRAREYTLPTHMTVELARLLGYLVGDGYINNDYIIGFNNTDRQVFADFERCFRAVFPDAPYTTRDVGPSSYGKQRYLQFDCNSAYLVRFLSTLGLHPGSSYDRAIPEVIFRSSAAEVGAFMSALYESDGSAGTCPSYCSVSEDLIHDIKQVLLNYFGIVTSKICSGNKIYIAGFRNVRRFQKHVNFISKRKRRRLAAAVAYLRDAADGAGNSKLDQVPHLNDFIRDFNTNYKDSARYVRTESGSSVFLNGQGWLCTSTLKSDSYKFRKSYRKLMRNEFITTEYPETAAVLTDVYERDYLYDKVVSVRKLKQMHMVYDLTVPVTHAFVANGFIAHNTESRLSTFSDLYMLDPDYLAVMDYVPNYDGNDKVPIVLPAKVPLILLNGYGSIAVGVAAESPPFKIEGVLKLVKLALSGKTVGPKLCAKYLVPDYPYGGTCISGPEEILELQETGKGSLRFQPSYELDRSRATMVINSACPGLMSGKTVQTLLERVAAEKLVATVDDDTGKTGVRYVIKGKRGVKDKQFDDMVQAVLKHATKSESYDVGITIRNVDGTAKFQKTTHHKILNMWVKWRIEIELKVIKRLREIQLFKQHRQELMLKAVDNLEIIIQALRVKKDKEIIRVGKEDVEVDASAAFLMRKLKIDLESANFIMDLKVRQLRLMDRNRILDQIKTHQAEVKALDRDAKQPDVRVLKQIEQLEANLANL